MAAATLERPHMTLMAETAADLMTANPVSLPQDATLREALALFTGQGFGVAPVIDRAGHPVGVISMSDILVHDRETVDHVLPRERAEVSPMATAEGEALPGGFHVERVDRTRIRDIMTPAIFSVTPKTHVAVVIEEMLRLHVHHLFVVDTDGTLIGVISALDVLRHMKL